MAANASINPYLDGAHAGHIKRHNVAYTNKLDVWT